MITLKNALYQATFNPEKGMNLMSFRFKEFELIDQTTLPLFEERAAGLGALIGPHFHNRPLSRIPPLYPSTEARPDPFSHGVARYAPWKVLIQSENSVEAVLTGKDEWNGVPLAQLEGQNFTMTLKAHLHDKGLSIDLSVVSDTDSLVGFHYYYKLPEGLNIVKAEVQSDYLDQGQPKPIPAEWGFDGKMLNFRVDKPADYTFHPVRPGRIALETPLYVLKIDFLSPCSEISWQLWHPEGGSFVCLEPLSAFNPIYPHLTASTLSLSLNAQ